MSQQISTAHVEQYRDNVIMLAQQKGSRLRPTARLDGDVVGKAVYYDRIGATAAVRNTARHADTPLAETPHSRRKAYLYDYDWADLIDKSDKYKTLYDPTNFYVRAAFWAMGRAMDDLMIEAASGNAYTGEDGSTVSALPSAQKILHGSTGLSLTKLISAKEKLDAAEVDPDVERHIIVSAALVTDMLNTTEIQSADYNSVRALVEGKVNTFLGFQFRRTERLATDSSSDILCLAYTGEALGFETGEDVMVDVGPRRDKRNATQVYVCMGIASTRVEDVQMVEIACNP